jgi:hypothetical protein
MTGKTDAARQRRQRLANALRENLKRRKAKARGREGAAQPASEEPQETAENDKDA